jgi:hypothetical protein
MTAFDIIGELKTYATARLYVFLTGNNFYQNYEVNINTLGVGQYVLACDFTSSPEYNLSKIKSITYQGFIMLGLKFNATGGTLANLDETFYQKYTRRLLTLHTALSAFLITFACDNELDILTCNMSNVINDFDDNIDFVKAEITFKDEIFTT